VRGAVAGIGAAHDAAVAFPAGGGVAAANSASLRRNSTEMSSSPCPCAISRSYCASVDSTIGSSTPAARGHVVADAQVLAVQAHAEPRRVAAAHDVRCAVHEIPARARALAERVDELCSGRPCALRECHRLGDGLDDAGAHDLVGRLGGLSGAVRAEVRDGPAHGLEHGAGARERGRRPADHDGERAVARAFDAAAHGRVEEFDLARRQTPRRLAGRVRADGGAVDDERADAQAGQQAVDDVEHVGIGRHAEHDHVACPRETREIRARDDAERGGEFRGTPGRPVPDGVQPPRFAELARHAAAHGAETHESSLELRHRRLTGKTIVRPETRILASIVPDPRAGPARHRPAQKSSITLRALARAASVSAASR
jgi:hypothetical protein